MQRQKAVREGMPLWPAGHFSQVIYIMITMTEAEWVDAVGNEDVKQMIEVGWVDAVGHEDVNKRCEQNGH
jgi:hypothetical protein